MPVGNSVPPAVLLRGIGGYTPLTAGGYTVVAVPNPVFGACFKPTAYPSIPPTPSNTAPSNIPIMVFVFSIVTPVVSRTPLQVECKPLLRRDYDGISGLQLTAMLLAGAPQRLGIPGPADRGHLAGQV